jgi:hypothetical protein
MRSYYSKGRLESEEWYPYKEENLNRHEDEYHVKMDADTEVMRLQIQSSRITSYQQKHSEQIVLQSSRRNNPTQHLYSGFLASITIRD